MYYKDKLENLFVNPKQCLIKGKSLEKITDAEFNEILNQVCYGEELSRVDDARRYAYAKLSDPLYMESYRLRDSGKPDEADVYKAQADAAVIKIKAENPWPTPPEVA